VTDRLRYGDAEWLPEDDATRRLEIRKRNTAFADVYMGPFKPSLGQARSSAATPWARVRSATSGGRRG
jgi:hypothetical protein